MSQSPAKWFLPPVASVAAVRPAVRVYRCYPELPVAVELFWARTQPTINLRRTQIVRREALTEARSNAGSVESKLAPLGKTVESKAASEKPSPLELAIVLAMGLVFEGSNAAQKDERAYIMLPCDRPAGAPPMGLYISGFRLHLFISDEDFKAGITFLGKGLASYLEAMGGEVMVLWHFMTSTPLAFGGTERAVESTGVSKDHGFVVWQWWSGGVLGAQGYSRRYGVHSTLDVELADPLGTWTRAVEFLEKSKAYSRPTPIQVWLPRPVSPRPARTQTDGPDGDEGTASARPNPPKALQGDPKTVGTPVGAQRTPLESPTGTPGEPFGITVGQAPRVTEEITNLRKQLDLAYANGNPAEVISLQARLEALEGA